MNEWMNTFNLALETCGINSHHHAHHTVFIHIPWILTIINNNKYLMIISNCHKYIYNYMSALSSI